VGGFLSLWLSNLPYRRVYQPTDNDVTALADGLLLVPGARWEDWFTRGHSNFFDAYPEWPFGLTRFARPVFQFVLYVAHFVFGSDWASYLAINYLCVAGVAAIAFAIARKALALDVAASLLAALLVFLSPAVLEYSIWQVGFASESLASMLIGGAFLAAVARRDAACVALLSAALFTKETSAWAPLAAFATILLRRESQETSRSHMLAASSMLLPLAVWLAFRFVFFGGVGGSYATAEYAPIGKFLTLVGWKIAHLHHLFIQQSVFVEQGAWALPDQAIRVATALLLISVVVVWSLKSLRAGWGELACVVRERRWPAPEAPVLTTLWAALGLAFYLAISAPSARYAASSIMFAWPAALSAIISRRGQTLRLAVLVCLAVPLARTAHFITEMNPPPKGSDVDNFFRSAAEMNATLRKVPPDIQQVYVFFVGGLVTANPDYLRAFLGIHAQIVRLTDTTSFCGQNEDPPIVNHDFARGEVTIRAKLPDCARFEFLSSNVSSAALVEGRIRRNESIVYEFPRAHPIERVGPFEPAIDLGSQMVVHIRLSGPARFITAGDGQIAWFDTP
jgi:hypothetical protein